MSASARVKVSAVVVVLLLLTLFPLAAGSYWLHLGILAGIGALLSLGLNVFFGYCGQANFGTVGFYAVGAYASALLQVKLGVNPWLALLLALVICCVFAFLVGQPLSRLRHHTLALGSFAIAYVIYLVASKWISLTGGEDGLSVPALIVFGRPANAIFYYYSVLGGVLVSYLGTHFLITSKVGRAFKAIKEDEIAAASSGVNIHRFWLIGLMWNAVLAGLAGVFYGQQSGWIAPPLFGIWTNILILLMVVLGGVASNLGAVIGGALVMLLPEALSGFQEYHGIVYGLLLFVALRFLPGGIVGGFKDFGGRVTHSTFWSALTRARASEKTAGEADLPKNIEG